MIYKAIIDNRLIDIIYTNLSKADQVNHKILIQKLESIGLDNTLINWFNSYLNNEIQFVKINNTLSKLI